MPRRSGAYYKPWPKLEFSQFDLGWLTALLEGEGSFTKRGNSLPASPRVKVNMTDLEPIVKAASLMSATVRGPYKDKRPGTKPQWHTSLSGPRALELSILLYEYLSPRRQEQIRVALDSWEHDERIV